MHLTKLKAQFIKMRKRHWPSAVTSFTNGYSAERVTAVSNAATCTESEPNAFMYLCVGVPAALSASIMVSVYDPNSHPHSDITVTHGSSMLNLNLSSARFKQSEMGVPVAQHGVSNAMAP